TKSVIAKYLEDERIRYFFQTHLGVSASRNKGVELSEGDFIVFLDSDDQFMPNLIQELNRIPLRSYDLVCWNVIKQIDNKKILWKPRKLEKIYNHIVANFLAGSV